MVKNMAMPEVSIIISVYNKIDFLKLVLAGLEIQSFQNFEVIISDDGSNEKFVSALAGIMDKSPLQIKHCWHPDNGFRKNIILNKSIQLASCDYLIFIDGDCIPHPEFVEEHVKNALKKVCLCGRRVNLSEGITLKLSPEKIKKGYLQKFSTTLDMLIDFLKMKVSHLKMGFYFKSGLLRKYLNRKERGLLGSNFSLFKSDILAINGFDERYVKPTFGEDSDIEFRMRLNNVKFKTVLNMAVQYHLYHELLPRPLENKELYESVLKEKQIFTPYGIKK